MTFRNQLVIFLAVVLVTLQSADVRAAALNKHFQPCGEEVLQKSTTVQLVHLCTDFYHESAFVETDDTDCFEIADRGQLAEIITAPGNNDHPQREALPGQKNSKGEKQEKEEKEEKQDEKLHSASPLYPLTQSSSQTAKLLHIHMSECSRYSVTLDPPFIPPRA